MWQVQNHEAMQTDIGIRKQAIILQRVLSESVNHACVAIMVAKSIFDLFGPTPASHMDSRFLAEKPITGCFRQVTV